MNTCMDSLWSTEITGGIFSPRDILETQALALREQTDGLLSAEVRLTTDSAEGVVYLLLDIVAPQLNGVRHRVLTVRYLADRIYPCNLDAEGLRTAEVAHSDVEFRELLREVLNSGQVKSLALSLIARARQQRPKEPPPVMRRHNGHRRLFRPAWVGVEADGEGEDGHEYLYDERSVGD